MFYMFSVQFLFLCLFIFFGYIVGKIFLRNFNFFSAEECCAFSILFGWSVFAFISMFLGFLGWLQTFKLFTVSMVTFILCLFIGIRNRCFFGNYKNMAVQDSSDSSFSIKISPFILLYFILIFYLTLYPVTEWDAISYHLPVAKEFVSSGKIISLSFLRFPVFPQLVDLFFILAIIFSKPILANLITYAMSIVLALLIFSFAGRYFNKRIGLVSSLIFLSSSIVLEYAIVPYVEIGATLFCFAAFYMLCLWVTEKNFGYGMLSAIFWGLALGAKYYAVVFFIISVLAVNIFFWRKFSCKQLLLLIAFSLLIAFPWYFRNYLFSGDVFFPFCKISRLWDDSSIESHLRYMRSFGFDRDIKEFFWLPENMLRYPDRFQGNIGLFIIAGAGIAMAFIKKWSRLIAFAVVIVIIYGLVWFCNFQIARYLFPILPILALLSGWGLNELINMVPHRRLWIWNTLIVILLIFGYSLCLKIIKARGPLPDTDSKVAEYLARHIPTYKGINFLNTLSKDKVVYALYDEGSKFYHKNKVIGDWFGFFAYQKIASYLSEPLLLRIALQDFGADYFLVNRKKTLISPDLLEKYKFKRIYEDSFVYVFKIL